MTRRRRIDTRLVRPSDTTAEAGRRVLQRQMSEFLSREYGLQATPRDPEVVHEMRVATRRMRAALRVFRGALGTSEPRFRTGLRRAADLLGNVRDSDVLLEFLREYAANAPAPQRVFVAQLARHEEAQRGTSRRHGTARTRCWLTCAGNAGRSWRKPKTSGASSRQPANRSR